MKEHRKNKRKEIADKSDELKIKNVLETWRNYYFEKFRDMSHIRKKRN